MGYITQEELLKGRKDLSPFLIHLTRDGQITRFPDINHPQGSDETLLAKESLRRILKDKCIEAKSPFGIFNLKVSLQRGDGSLTNPGSKVDRNWLLSVCFSETPLSQIHFQVMNVLGRRLNFKPYGLALFEASVRAKGGNPIFYFNSENKHYWIKKKWTQVEEYRTFFLQPLENKINEFNKLLA